MSDLSTDDAIRVQPGIIVAVALGVFALILSLFAVGRALASDNGGTGVSVAGAAAADLPVAVSLVEFSIGGGSITAAAGGSLAVSNDGSAEHNLRVQGEAYATQDLAPGASQNLSLAGLAAGTYELWCTIPGHTDAGMTATLTLTEGDAGVAAPAEATSDYLTKEQADAKMANMMSSLAAFPAQTTGAGAQVMEPTIMDDGTKLFELVVDEIDWEVAPGQIAKGMAYNGQIPGPTIEVDLGDRYIIRVTNMLDNEATSLHPHGVNGHAFAYDGVAPITQDPILSGETYDYVFEADQPSLGMYHSHMHSLHQIPDGLVGAIIAGDYTEATNQIGVTQEHVMVLNDAGVIGFSLNGKSFPATDPYVAKAGERVMVHYMNEGVMSHPMHLHGQTGLVVAKDGFPLPAPYRMDTINVAPGERYTVVYDAEVPGTWVWHCHILPHVKKSDGSMFGMLTAMIVEEADGTASDGGDLGTTIDPDQLPSEDPSQQE
ncbi:MAG: FtsP/CotA-like multicopper oxidase with cupredoxin domain [Nonlabens sp.]|jgi:FtsP/CotA-like multicopper oxidase with cupredoxin domain